MLCIGKDTDEREGENDDEVLLEVAGDDWSPFYEGLGRLVQAASFERNSEALFGYAMHARLSG